MERMKIYDVPHKGLRNALSQLQHMAGKTDYTDIAEMEKLYALGKDVFEILTIHAQDENEVTLAALEQRCPGCSQHDVDDHQQIDLMQTRLEDLLKNLYTGSKVGENASRGGQEFYLTFTEFYGRYLEHTAEEERVTQPLLWKHFTDEELASHRARIMARNPPETLLIWFRFVLPAQSHKERVGLLSGFKKMAPAAFFNEGMSVINRVLEPAEFAALQEALERI